MRCWCPNKVYEQVVSVTCYPVSSIYILLKGKYPITFEAACKRVICTIREMNFIKRGVCILFTSVILYSCYRHNDGAISPMSTAPGSSICDTSNVSYDSTISPILLQNCAITGCHASGSATGGYTFDSYSGVRTAVLAGRLIGAITHASGFSPMPKDRAMLDDCQVALLTSWVEHGAQNN